ncbi:MAG TPA: CehA/McbA family metallohydrolase [Steroidobacteraceae bacterium]
MKSALLGCLLTAFCASACAGVRVIVGPTPIKGGEAKSAGDITVVNEKLAFALAVQSPVPYGVPRGAIIDVAPVVNGEIGRDCVVFADFIPNNWSAWPNTFQHIEILQRGPTRVVVRTVRDWGKVTITTLYTLAAAADSIAIRTTMHNGGAALADLLSGLTLWPKGGHFFGVPGLRGVVEGSTEMALADRVVAYDEQWSVALHAPYADHIADGSLDLYRLHTLAAGESRVFEGWLQVGASGDLKPVIAAEIARRHLTAGTVRGTVAASNAQPVEAPVIVVEKHGKPYGWVLGRGGVFEFALAQGDYLLYATAKGYSESARIPLQVKPGAVANVDFRELRPPGNIRWSVADARSGAPVDARINIEEGQKPLVEFLGRNTFFTELERRGRVDVPIAPGDYRFSVSSGGGFLAQSERVKLSVAPGEARAAQVALTRLFDPPARHWYAADLHHHADQAEAVTPPADLARSQLAAGLDLLFVSDHDSTVNHATLRELAERRGVAFIPGIELSASWGHFNAYPLAPDQTLAIDTGTASIDELLTAARRMGATVVQVNHPFIPYGYFTSVSRGVAPGGFNPSFDLIEINAAAPADDAKVLRTLWNFWNAGHRYYLAAGTDTHDVWHEESGAVRTFAHIDGAVTAVAYAQALKDGHGYVTFGPLIFPSVIFGDELRVKPREPFNLGFDLQAVAGLKQVELIESGRVLKTEAWTAASQQVHVDFPLTTEHATWYSLIVEDNQGHKAYSDPIWVDTVAGLTPESRAAQ